MARLQTKALFFETTLPEYRIEMEPEWTLKEKDHLANDGKTYRSMKKIYLEEKLKAEIVAEALVKK